MMYIGSLTGHGGDIFRRKCGWIRPRRMMAAEGIAISSSIIFFSLILLFHAPAAVSGRLLAAAKPNPDDAASTARWLVAQNSWGVLSTISSDLGGSPFGNVVSFSDGVPDEGLGTPYFYLTTLDPTARHALADGRSSFTLSEFPLGSCGKIDPENPTCAKLTLTGKLKLVDSASSEADFARLALFSKHPEMEDWPKNHNFQIFNLEIEDIFLIDWFGGPKPLSPDQYFSNGRKYFPVYCSVKHKDYILYLRWSFIVPEINVLVAMLFYTGICTYIL